MTSDSTPKGQRRTVRIGKYEVLAHIATGGMGAVYRAFDTEQGREVALKVLTPELAVKPAMIERFRREARHAAKLRHENIVTIFEFGETNGTFFIAMEFVDGVDLHDFVQRKGPLDPAEALTIVTQACQALDHAHQTGIVHRDIKPSNFLVAGSGEQLQVKLTDLGLAREANNEEFRVTKAGTTVGTLDYMAPEQAHDSGKADVRSDLYSLGCTWYHLLAGQPPFHEGGLAQRLLSIMKEEPPDVRTLNPRVSAATWAALRRLLAKSPAERFQTPADLLTVLNRLESGADLSPRDLLAGLAVGETEDQPVSPTPKRPGKRAARATRSETTEEADQASAKARRRRQAAASKETDAEEPITEAIPSLQRQWPYLWPAVGGVLLLVLVVVLVIVLGSRHRPEPAGPLAQDDPALSSSTLPPAHPAVVGGESTPPGRENPDRVLKTPDPPPAVPPKALYPALYTPSLAVSPDALRKEIQAPWAGQAVPADAVVLAVGRGAGSASSPVYPSFGAALKAAPPGKACVLELHDNGPFFDVPVTVSDRPLVIRAGRGYRPLLVWDIGRGKGSAFLEVQRGGLTLQDLNVVVKWPEGPSEGATLLRVQDGDLTLSGCTFSVAGKPRDGMVLARVRAGTPADSENRPERKGKTRCRFSRCHVRGGNLSALSLDAPGAEVLFEDCLIVGGDEPLLEVRADAERAVNVRVAGSTLVAGKTLLSVQPANKDDLRPALNWLGWDSLLSRAGQGAGGELVQLADGASPDHIRWRAINCLYAGWQNLLSGKTVIPATDTEGWRRRWQLLEGDAALARPWPAIVFTEPAVQPASAYNTASTPVAFRSSTAADRPLGCDLASLPPVTDDWLALTFDRFTATPPAPPDDPGPPTIDMAFDGLYHGERIDLGQVGDLGAYLEQVQKVRKLAPRVVLHLAGTGDHSSSPIRFRGKHLVVWFEPPAKKEAASPALPTPNPMPLTPVRKPAEEEKPLALVLSGRNGRDALLEVEQGDLDLMGVTIRAADYDGNHTPASWLVKVGGDLRMYRSRLEGPYHHVPADYRGLILLAGSGETAADHVRSVASNASILVSGQAGVVVRGIGGRLLLKQTLLVAGTSALRFEPGRTGAPGGRTSESALSEVRPPGGAFKGRANLEVLLEQTTVAARGSVVRLADVSSEERPAEPIVMQTHGCAFLAPFSVRPGEPRPRTGLLLYNGSALSHGLLVWQSERDLLDRRLTFAASRAGDPLPDKSEDLPACWARLWGSPSLRRPAPDPAHALAVFPPDRWPVERLPLSRGPGADITLLPGLKKGTSKSPGSNPSGLRIEDR
jgi:serine/threonine protein kinase